MTPVSIRIVGERLPGLVCGDHQNVHLALQKGKEYVDPVPGDAAAAVFDLQVVRRDGDFRGPFVHGTPGDRFVYLAWVDVNDETEEMTMFARIKVMLDAIPGSVLREGTTKLEAYLPLSDDRRRPLAAAVRPPLVTWTAG